MNDLKRLNFIYTILDVVFCIIFLFLVFLKHDHSLILYIFAVIVLLSYYALWTYARQVYTGKPKYLKDNEWHRKCTTISALFTLFRVVLFMAILFSCIISTAHVDVVETIINFEELDKILLGTMLGILSALGILSYNITNIHDSHARVLIKGHGVLLQPVADGEIYNGKTAIEMTKELQRR